MNFSNDISSCSLIMKAFLVLALAVATVSAGTIPAAQEDKKTGVSGRITNGYDAPEDKAPYLVGLYFDQGVWCGGSIISNTWVVTAAHCTNGAPGVTINYGASNRNSPQYTHHVGSGDFIQCRYWPDINGNDISLIRTPHVDFWSRVNKVELPSFNDRYNSYAGWWAVACGWGITDNNQGMPDWKQCVDVQIMSNADCSRVYNINDGILCTSVVDGRGVCSGDSGGPLVTHDGNKLVGVTSFAPGNGCKSGLPDGFTRVTNHLDWIREHTGVAYY